MIALVLAAMLAVTYPNPALTPGDVLTHVTVRQICTPGYTASVRYVPLSVRQQVLRAYGYIGPASAIELDHLISLEAGGSNSPKNLWPQPIVEAKVKDQDENRLHRDVCAGRLTLQQAQAAILREWSGRVPPLPSAGPLTEGKIPVTMPRTGGGGIRSLGSHLPVEKRSTLCPGPAS